MQTCCPEKLESLVPKGADACDGPERSIHVQDEKYRRYVESKNTGHIVREVLANMKETMHDGDNEIRRLGISSTIFQTEPGLLTDGKRMREEEIHRESD